MKVSVCRKCRYFRERRWSQYYEPRNYHPIGMSHKYGYCARWKKRCTEVKDTDCTPGQTTLFDATQRRDERESQSYPNDRK